MVLPRGSERHHVFLLEVLAAVPGLLLLPLLLIGGRRRRIGILHMVSRPPAALPIAGGLDVVGGDLLAIVGCCANLRPFGALQGSRCRLVILFLRCDPLVLGSQLRGF